MLFGSKNNKGNAILKEVYENLSKKYDLSHNKLKPGVKFGRGPMINDNIYVEVYISYKNEEKFGVQMVFTQKQPDSSPFFTVRKYFEAWDKRNKHYQSNEYSLEDIEQAKSKYEEYLKEIITL